MNGERIPKSQDTSRIPQQWQIAIFGTFDVENYGDLLFPIIAEVELKRRLGCVKLHRFSYHAKEASEWPYVVTSLTELPALASRLDGVLIGGGFIVRFDKEVASGYGSPSTDIHHPTGYWLSPALIAVQLGIPLIWNAPGMHCNDIPEWAEPLLKLTIGQSQYVAVRDEPSRKALSAYDDADRIAVLPDTAFGIPEMVDDARPSHEFMQLRQSYDLEGPYVVVQAARFGLDYFLNLLRDHAPRFARFRFLVIPIGPVLGDDEHPLVDRIPGAVFLPYWPEPLLLAELISHAEAVVGHSYHLAITALAFGIPVHSSADLASGKYTALSDFETLYPLSRQSDIDPDWFLSRLGKGRPCTAACRRVEQLRRHWDHIAAILATGQHAPGPIPNRFWQSLPTLLETTADRADLLETKYAELEQKSQASNSALAASHHELVEHRMRIQLLEESLDRGQEAVRTVGDALIETQQRLLESEAKCLSSQLDLDQQRDHAASLQAAITRLYESRSMRLTAPLRYLFRSLTRRS